MAKNTLWPERALGCKRPCSAKSFATHCNACLLDFTDFLLRWSLLLGTIIRIDADGDALIDFGLPQQQWVMKCDFGNLKPVEGTIWAATM